MSTIKADTVAAVASNGDLSLDGLGTGGVSIASTLKMTKGGDISSASPLVIDTDGNYFDVTGTTNFSAMTVEEGNFFMLQFDGALTITHGSGIELPGAADLTTATGDRLVCYATAANTVEVMSVELEAGTAASTFTQGTEQATTSGTSVTFGSIPAGIKLIYGMLMGVSSDANIDIMVQLGDSGGIETSGYLGSCSNIAAAVAANQSVTDAFDINKFNAADIVHGTFILTLADTSNTWTYTSVCGQSAGISALSYMGGGQKPLSGELTQVHVKIPSGAFTAGSINIMYL